MKSRLSPCPPPTHTHTPNIMSLEWLKIHFQSVCSIASLQAFSALGHEGILHARTMGIRAVFTDHSLFGFADASSVITNKFLEVMLTDIDHVICVSYTRCAVCLLLFVVKQHILLANSKENTVLRASLRPENVSVIPNAVDTACFTPQPVSRKNGQGTYFTWPHCLANISYLSLPSSDCGCDEQASLPKRDRHFGRHHSHLVCKSLRRPIPYWSDTRVFNPLYVHLHNNFPFSSPLTGGDGPKRVLLEETREKLQLQDRVHLLGSLDHSQVRDVSKHSDKIQERTKLPSPTLPPPFTGVGSRGHLP